MLRLRVCLHFCWADSLVLPVSSWHTWHQLNTRSQRIMWCSSNRQNETTTTKTRKPHNIVRIFSMNWGLSHRTNRKRNPPELVDSASGDFKKKQWHLWVTLWIATLVYCPFVFHVWRNYDGPGQPNLITPCTFFFSVFFRGAGLFTQGLLRNAWLQLVRYTLPETCGQMTHNVRIFASVKELIPVLQLCTLVTVLVERILSFSK